MTVVLSPYPVSSASLDLLRSEAGTEFLTLAELRLQALPEMVARLRSVRSDRIRIVIQEPSERALLPLMLTLAALTRARELQVDDLEQGTVAAAGRGRAALGLGGILAATVAGRIKARRLRRQTTHLMNADPGAFGSVASDKALYLKTNLMLGVKAGGSVGHIAGVLNEFVRRDPRTVLIAPEFPPLVHPATRFEPVAPLTAYGMPAEVNHFRFNDSCERVGADVLQREAFGFIYQRLTLGNLSGVELSRRFNVPLVLEYNGSEVWVSQNWGHKLNLLGLATAVEEVCLRHAHRVVAVSEVLADELRTRGVPSEKIVWYPNCIDPELFDPKRHAAARLDLRAKFAIEESDLVVLFIGTFGPWHGAEILAEAAKRCLRSPAPGLPRLKFAFVGDGVRAASVRAMLSEEAARNDVIFTGLVPQGQAPGYLAMADIFSAPHVAPPDGSKFFGSPTKLFEYMAMERPIIASDLDQLGDILRPAITDADIRGEPDPAAVAVLVAPGSGDAITNALVGLQRRSDLRASLARAARKKALASFTWRNHVDAIVASLR